MNIDNTRYKSPEGKTYVFSKGAAEYLIPQCTNFLKGSEVIPMSQAVCLEDRRT